MKRKISRNWLWAMVPVLIFSVFLGVHNLRFRTVTYDEYWTLYNSGGAEYGPLPISGIWNRIATEDPWQSPGYFMAIAAWGKFVGWSDVAIRWLSALAGLLAAAWVFKLGRDSISPLGGFFTALTLGSSVFYSTYFREMRGYTFYVLFTIITVWGYWQIINGSTKKLSFILFFVGVLGIFYTHYFAVFTPLVLSVYHVLFVKKNRQWWIPVILMGAAFILFLPWIGVALKSVAINNADQSVRRNFMVDSKTIVQYIVFLFSNGSIALLAVIALNSLRLRNRITALVWFWSILFMVIAIAINELMGAVGHVRYLIAMWPALALISGIGLERLTKDGIRPVIVIAVWVAASIINVSDPAYFKIFENSAARLPWDDFAKTLAPHVVEQDKVVFLLPDDTDYDSHRYAIAHYTYGLPGQYLLLESPRHLQGGYLNKASGYTSYKQRLWVGYSPAESTDIGAFDRVLIKTYLLCGDYIYTPRLRVRAYAPLMNDNNPRLIFGDGKITLRLLTELPTVAKHNFVAMVSSSTTSDVPLNTYSIALHIVDSTGKLVAQKDYGLTVSDIACENNEIALDNVPSGSYSLKVSVYNWQTGEKLPGKKGTTGETSEELDLGSFEVDASSN